MNYLCVCVCVCVCRFLRVSADLSSFVNFSSFGFFVCFLNEQLLKLKKFRELQFFKIFLLVHSRIRSLTLFVCGCAAIVTISLRWTCEIYCLSNPSLLRNFYRVLILLGDKLKTTQTGGFEFMARPFIFLDKQ